MAKMGTSTPRDRNAAKATRFRDSQPKRAQKEVRMRSQFPFRRRNMLSWNWRVMLQ
jgi:hypothetical protein